MNKSGWNPTRRNRNIGTAKSGYSKDNMFVVPEKWAGYRVFWERLENPVACPLSIKGHNLTLLVEPTRPGYIHSCTPGDIEKILSLTDIVHLKEIELIVLRQPKKKEEILHPVWGRFIYYADIGRHSGPGVYIEAIAENAVIKWSKSLTPFDKKELDALKNDGHRVEKLKRGYDIHTSPAAVRNTQLFRTLPHEIGHAVDFLLNSLNPSVAANTEQESDYISESYRSKSTRDKEEFANRYAREFYQTHASLGILPFEKIYSRQQIAQLGLSEKWFC